MLIQFYQACHCVLPFNLLYLLDMSRLLTALHEAEMLLQSTESGSCKVSSLLQIVVTTVEQGNKVNILK